MTTTPIGYTAFIQRPAPPAQASRKPGAQADLTGVLDRDEAQALARVFGEPQAEPAADSPARPTLGRHIDVSA